MTQKLGAGGWPLVSSPHFPGELCIACPKCSSTSIVMSVKYPVYGTGPGNSGRLGDVGTMNTNYCCGCGNYHEYK